jgi:hypothetical protein
VQLGGAVDVLDVVVLVLRVVELAGGFELELELETGGGELPPEVVEPISPHLMLEKVMWVFGLLARIVVGLPSVLLQGPLLPLSSQFM